MAMISASYCESLRRIKNTQREDELGNLIASSDVSPTQLGLVLLPLYGLTEAGDN